MFLWIRNKSVLLIRSFLPPSFSCSFIHIPPNTPFFQALKQKMLLEKLPWWDYPWTCSLTAVDSNTTYEQQSCRKAQSKHLLPVFFSVFFFFLFNWVSMSSGYFFLKDMSLAMAANTAVSSEQASPQMLTSRRRHSQSALSFITFGPQWKTPR